MRWRRSAVLFGSSATVSAPSKTRLCVVVVVLDVGVCRPSMVSSVFSAAVMLLALSWSWKVLLLPWSCSIGEGGDGETGDGEAGDGEVGDEEAGDGARVLRHCVGLFTVEGSGRGGRHVPCPPTSVRLYAVYT